MRRDGQADCGVVLMRSRPTALRRSPGAPWARAAIRGIPALDKKREAPVESSPNGRATGRHNPFARSPDGLTQWPDATTLLPGRRTALPNGRTPQPFCPVAGRPYP